MAAPTITELARDVTDQLTDEDLLAWRARGIAMGGTTPVWPDICEAIDQTLTVRGIPVEGA